ncbi:MAG: hydrolase [Nitrospiraceae bacterium]|nr:hydrolase [Nitrospiraceae bacterium]
MALDRFLLDNKNAALLIIDIQERLAVVMDRKDEVVRNTLHLVELAKAQNIPVVVTEQYPKGLGRTLPEISTSLPAYLPIEKVTFNCCGQPTFSEQIKGLGRKKIIVTGMETHICVLQTSLGLLKECYDVHLVQDAVCSRTEANWRSGLELVRDAGGVITNTETVLFQLLGAAGTPEFKMVSQRIK